VCAVPAMPKKNPKNNGWIGGIDIKIVVIFAEFWPISPTKRPINGKILIFCKACWVALAYGSMLKTCHL